MSDSMATSTETTCLQNSNANRDADYSNEQIEIRDLNKEEANNIFVLINQLNNKNSSTIYSNDSIQSSTNNSKSTFNDQNDNNLLNGSSLSLLKINENNNNNSSANNNNNEDNSLNLSNDSMLSSPSLSTNDDKMSNEQEQIVITTSENNQNLTPENGNFSVNELNRRLNGLANNNEITTINNKIPKPSGMTRIPRIPNLKSSNAFPMAPEAVAPTTLGLLNKSIAISSNDANWHSTPIDPTPKPTNLVRPTKISINRVTRSSSKSSCINSEDKNSNNELKSSRECLTQNQPLKQRGLSSCSVNKSNRSLSVSSPNDDSFNEPEFNTDGTRNVRYVVRHKPKESKVKIFSEKIKPKNVTSKIGSFDKANHVPGGGNVQIESKQLNWNAESKIKSLEKANYQPNGGNIKIENHKIQWNAQSKIKSLEKANYKPAGGNVKIESHKLNFKEKARPKTDTGLLVIEVSKPSYSSMVNSQYNSNERLNDLSRRLSFESN